MEEAVRALLFKTSYKAAAIDGVLDPDKPTWARFDSEFGYLLNDAVVKDGVGGSATVYSYEPGGQRRMVNYVDRPCRINTYGNSFTQCHQVSDGETWQEQLAAHIQEPIRNFGIGGWGVYQAYRRARRVELTDCAAEYVILNILDDDHVRNIDMARWVRSNADNPEDDPVFRPQHGLPWAHLRYDLAAGRFVDIPGPCAGPEDLRKLGDKQEFYKAFKDDAVVRLFVLQRGGELDDVSEFEALAEAFGVDVDLRDPKRNRADARRLYIEYALRSTQHFLAEMRPWLESQGKKLMVVLSYSRDVAGQALREEERFDASLVDWLEQNEFCYVDSTPFIVDDYRQYNLTVEEYLDRTYIPPQEAAVAFHYNPVSNHMFAFWVKDAIVKWLNPKPPAYR